MKPFEPDQIKTFRTPKYTGVTLSLLSMFVLASMVVVWNKMHSNYQSKEIPLSVICDDSFRQPVTECLDQFTKELNIPISIEYYSPDELEIKFNSISIENGKTYDLLIASEIGPKNGLIFQRFTKESVTIANRSLIFATRNNSNLKIKKWSDLSDQNITLGLCDRNARSGQALQKILESSANRSGNTNHIIFKTDTELSNNLMNSSELDGIVVWYNTAIKLGLKIHQLEEFKLNSIPVTSKVISSTKNASKSLMFSRFLAAPSKGQFHFANNNILGTNGDIWNRQPTLRIYTEPIFKNSIINLTEHFEKREGVTIDLKFPNIEKLIFTISSISQSNAPNLLPDLLLVSHKTAAEIPPNYILTNSENSFTKGLFLLHSKSRHGSLAKRLTNYKPSKK